MSNLDNKVNQILSRPVAADPTDRGMQSEEVRLAPPMPYLSHPISRPNHRQPFSNQADAAMGADILFDEEEHEPPAPGLPDLDVLGADPAVFSEPAFASGEPPHVTKADAAQAQRLEEWLYGEQRAGGLASVMQVCVFVA